MVKGVGTGNRTIPRNAAGITGKASLPCTDLPTSAFRQILETTYKQNEIIFSAHARNRLENRNIKLGLEDLQKISRAMDKAEAKGARSPLLLYKDVALVASIPNRTIITAVDGSGENEQIFTDIDSAIIFK